MRLTQDIVSGIATIVLAILVLLVLSRIPQSSYQAIAPDLFPRLCAIGLILAGLVLIGRGAVRGGADIGALPWRALAAVIGSVVAFGAVAPWLGCAPAGLLTLLISGLGTPELKFRQLLIVSVVLTIFAAFLFGYVLKLSLPILVLPGIRL